jgi:hypothetical protein
MPLPNNVVPVRLLRFPLVLFVLQRKSDALTRKPVRDARRKNALLVRKLRTKHARKLAGRKRTLSGIKRSRGLETSAKK